MMAPETATGTGTTTGTGQDPAATPMAPADLLAGPHAPILTVTLNPALDLAAGCAQVRPNQKLRLDSVLLDPGGGGINIARVIAALGGRARAAVSLGGPLGAEIATMLAEAGIETLALPAPGHTRLSLAVENRAEANQYRFSLPGPDWDETAAETALQQLTAAAPAGGWVALSGSSPPGVPDDFALALAHGVAGAGARLLVDTSGPQLRRLVAARAKIAVLRLDRLEAEGLAGAPLPERADSAGFARRLIAEGVAQIVVVARGADGNILADARGAWHATALPVTIVSAVGAGDSFVAGLLIAEARGADWPQALALAAACATATCLQPATRLAQPDDVARLLAQGRVMAMG